MCNPKHLHCSSPAIGLVIVRVISGDYDKVVKLYADESLDHTFTSQEERA